MGVLQSPLFTEGDPVAVKKLEDCATGQPNQVVSHFKVGHANATGEHIRRVQQALKNVQQARPEFGIPVFAINGIYDQTFARAIQVYKAKKNIRNHSNQIDDVVGMKTIKSLDSDNAGTPHQNPPTPPGPSPVPPQPPAPAPFPSPVPNHKLLSGGAWSGATTLSVQGGQSMTFVLTNTNILGTTITIKAQTGETHSQVLLPGQTAHINFSVFGGEPKGWTFGISTQSDAFLVTWQLWSTWVPGDPPNP